MDSKMIHQIDNGDVFKKLKKNFYAPDEINEIFNIIYMPVIINNLYLRRMMK